MKIDSQTRLFLRGILVLFVIVFCSEGFSFHGYGYGYNAAGEHVNGAWAYRRQKAKQLPSAAYFADIEGGYPYNQGSPAQDMTYYDDPAVVIPNTGPAPWHYRVWNDRIGVGISAYPRGYGFDGRGSFAGHAGYIYADPNVANAQGAVIRNWNGHNSYFNIPQSVYREQRQLSRGMNGRIVGVVGNGEAISQSVPSTTSPEFTEISSEQVPEAVQNTDPTDQVVPASKKIQNGTTNPLDTKEFSTTPAQEPKKTSMNGYSTSPSNGHYNQQYVSEDPGMGNMEFAGSFGGSFDCGDPCMDPCAIPCADPYMPKKECAIISGLKKIFSWRPKTSCLSKGFGGASFGSCLGRGVSGSCLSGFDPCFSSCDPCFSSCDPCFSCCDPCFSCCDPCFSCCDPCFSCCDPCGGNTIMSGGTGSCCGADNGDMSSFSTNEQSSSNGQLLNQPTPAPATSGSTPDSGNKNFGIDSSIKTTTPSYPFGQKPASSAVPQKNPAPSPAANPTKTPSPLPGTSGVLQMNVPENSVVYINGYRTKLTGTERNYTAKNLIPGESYEFEVKVVSVEDGQLREQVKTTSLTPGNTAILAFDFTEQRPVHTIALK